MSVRDLDALFRPKSIALIGASTKPGSVGAVLAANLLRAGFQGPIVPVNPNHPAIGGVLTYPSIEALPIVPDLGVVAVPPDAVEQVVGALASKGARATIVITAGFGEGGDAHGHGRRQALLQAAGRMRILGPNVLGAMVPAVGLNASFAHLNPDQGDLAFVAQSGAILTAVLDWAKPKGIGFSHLVSLGDMADVDFGDMLDYLASDPKVRAILLYIEAVTNARKFMSAARRAARTKPVVVIKAGRHAEGARAASSHTGALAGADAVYDAAFRRAGMLRVTTLQELFDAVETLSARSELRGERMAILTNGGGLGVLAVDRLIDFGGTLAELSADTIKALDAVLPPTWSHANPVDIIGDADGQRYGRSISAVLADPGVDALLVLNCPTAIASSLDAAVAVVDATKSARKPVFTSWLGEGAAADARRLFAENRLPSYKTPDDAVRAFAHSAAFRRNQEFLMQVPSAQPPEITPDRELVGGMIDSVLKEGRSQLTEAEAKAILSSYGIPVAHTLTAATPEEAKERAATFTGPYAVKILSKDISHKSDVGGVVLNIKTPDQVEHTSRRMMTSLGQDFPQARIDGVTVQAMINRPGARELIVGMVEDSQFGPAILFGEGGTAVEVLGDTAMALPPLNGLLAHALIEETRVSKLLKGYRDVPPADLDAIADVLIRVAQIAIDWPQLKELDINPLLADAAGVVALDARMRLAAADAGPSDARLAIKPYPQYLETTTALRDGRPMHVRPIRPEDAPALRAMVQRTDPEDIRLRFLHPMRHMPVQLAARLTQLDYDREIAFAAINPHDPGAIIAISHLSEDPDRRRAEYAVIVQTDWKGKGLGLQMMNLLIAHARRVGLEVLYGEVLTENLPMLEMCRDLNFKLIRDPDDFALTHVELTL